MSAIQAPNKKSMMLFSGRAHEALAEEIAHSVGVELTPTSLYEFPRGEV